MTCTDRSTSSLRASESSNAAPALLNRDAARPVGTRRVTSARRRRTVSGPRSGLRASGTLVMLRTFGSSLRPGGQVDVVRSSTSRSTATPSISEKPAPMQRRTPPPNGIQVLVATSPSRNRSGRNTSVIRVVLLATREPAGSTPRRSHRRAGRRRRWWPAPSGAAPPSGSPGAAASTPSARPRGSRCRRRPRPREPCAQLPGSLPSSCSAQDSAVAVVSCPASSSVTSWSRSSSSVSPVSSSSSHRQQPGQHVGPVARSVAGRRSAISA